jgi:hypothetical protein
VNETLSLSDKTGSGSATVSGTFCGQSMNETETISD